MMSHVGHVIANDEFERKFSTVWFTPYVPERLRIHEADYLCQLGVVYGPQPDDLLPRLILIALNTNPIVLGISRELDALAEL